MSCQEEKDQDKKAKGKGKKIEKKKAQMEIHLIKANHGIIEGKEPLAMLPQIFPISLAEAFVQPLDRKMKTNGKMSTMVRDICKPTLRIDTWVNTEKFLFMTNASHLP